MPTSDRVLVLQSHDPSRMPAWVRTCLESVRRWAEGCGFGYRFIGDELFDGVGTIDRARVGSVLPITDYARLLRMRDILARGDHDRVLWVDADVVVFRPESLRIDLADGCGFCKELWVSVRPDGRVWIRRTVNNSFMHFDAGDPTLAFYIDACERFLFRSRRAVTRCQLGPDLLEPLCRVAPFSLHEQTATLNPELQAEVLGRDRRGLSIHGALFGAEVCAANLCASLPSVSGVSTVEVIERLLATRGACLDERSASASSLRAVVVQPARPPNATPWLVDPAGTPR